MIWDISQILNRKGWYLINEWCGCIFSCGGGSSSLVFAVVTLVKSKRDCTQPVNAKVIAFDDFVE